MTGGCGPAEAEARARLARHSPDALVQQGTRAPWRILWEQLTATMLVILLVAIVVSAVLGDFKDAVVILVIVVINAALGFAQEYRAERAVAALQRLTVPVVRARRDGQVRQMSAHDLVPGDVVLLEAGNLVPADCALSVALSSIVFWAVEGEKWLGRRRRPETRPPAVAAPC